MTAHPSGEAVAVARQVCEPDTVIGKHRMDAIGHNRDEVVEDRPSRGAGGAEHQSGEGELAGPVDGHEEVERAFRILCLCNVNMEAADGIVLEPLALGLVIFDNRQARNAMALEAPMQRGAGQVRERRMQGVEAIVQRQQRMAPELRQSWPPQPRSAQMSEAASGRS